MNKNNISRACIIVLATIIFAIGFFIYFLYSIKSPPKAYFRAEERAAEWRLEHTGPDQKYYQLADAIEKNDTRLVHEQLVAGANPNALPHGANGGEGIESLLSVSIGAHASISIVMDLLNHHADPNLQDFEYGTPLLAAIELNRPDIVKILVEHGALVNEPVYNMYSYRTPLDFAQDPVSPCSECAVYLIHHGAKKYKDLTKLKLSGSK